MSLTAPRSTMHVMFRLPLLALVLPVTATSLAAAETPMPDPIAPAVVGRPLDEIRPYRPVRAKPKVTKAVRPKPVAIAGKSKAATVAMGAAPAAAVATAAVATLPAQAAPTAPHGPKQALDDRIDPQARLAAVGKGTNLGRKPLGPGAYLNSRDQALVRKYYDAHPTAAHESRWKIGEPVPARAKMTGVPDQVRAALSKLPPGHQYVQLDGEVVLVALPSRMVVDGVSRAAR